MERVFSFSHTTILTAASLSVALTIAAPAGAAPIRFDNPAGPGHFEWGAIPNSGDEVVLSLLHGPGDQNAVNGDLGAFRQRNRGALGTDVRRSGPSPDGVQLVVAPSGGLSHVVGVMEGTEIPTPGTDGFSSGSGIWINDPVPGDPNSIIDEGVETYLGVRFDLGNGLQHGWIGVVRTGITLDAFAWGYETEPGVPIAAGVPEPGTLSLLMIAGAALLRRRKRHE